MGDTTAPAGLALVQELINTLDVESGNDALSCPEGIAAFSLRHGLALAQADLSGVRRLREALREVCRAHTGTDLDAGTAATLHRMLTAAPLVLRLDRAGRAALVPADTLTGLPALTARLAAAIAVAEAEGTWQRLKACEAEDCQWAYYDRSPAGRRRWCSMQTCGSRAKMRTYRARRRGAAPGEAPADGRDEAPLR
ncbi:CGNR zinc finger domain-containing protein [Streptomyces aidingensis]|uniref:Putative stress-induced transcription regulator n=1 Tax=Streptomyces aidingensis TaxID=910347 RepID=A0A1I1GS79_9ACTN|nr:CGNR zinc finger domain-containing protein [Streptomyces aidingensis]SFC11910.1 Putative stress-induced transcription regulator [Streptomyces aidingensis]